VRVAQADAFPVDVTVADADVASYDGLVLPGGVANPDALRTDAGAVALVRRLTGPSAPDVLRNTR
jgi:protease I